MVGLWLFELEDHALRVRVDSIGIDADVEFAQPVDVVHRGLETSGRWRRVIHEEPAVAGELRMEGETEKTSLVVLGIEADEAVG